MKKLTSALLAVLTLVSISGMKCSRTNTEESTKPVYEFRKDGELRILSPNGAEKASFDIEIVSSEDDLMRGLKFRESMEPGQGMLFIFDGMQPHGFWMQDTYIPLDMLFIGSDEVIFQIEENTVPFSEEHINAEAINKYTLEINAGLSAKYNIQKGDRIEWKRID